MERVFTDVRTLDDVIENCTRDCVDMLEDATLLNHLELIKFDIVLVDAFVVNKCLLLIPHILRIPFIYVSSVSEPAWHIRLPSFPSIVPYGMSSLTEDMNFFQKLYNIYINFEQHTWGNMADKSADILVKYRKDISIDTYDVLARHSAMFFFTKDYLLEYNRPLYSNCIELGGLTVRDATPLPKKWSNLLDSSKHGVILISFGSTADYFPNDVLARIVSGLHLVQYDFIWKVGESFNVSSLPRNIYTTTWLPQNDLLGDRRIKGYISNAGNNGQYEAVYHGVPMIAIPLLGDQVSQTLLLIIYFINLFFIFYLYRDSKIIK